MSLDALGAFLRSTDAYRRLLASLRGRPLRVVAQVLAEASPYTLATLWRDLGVPVLVIAPRPDEALRLRDQLATWTGLEERVLHFPETETLPFERLVSDLATTHQRVGALADLLTPAKVPPILVASAAAVAQRTLDADTFSSSSHTLRTGDEVEMEEVLGRWRRMGYRFEPSVFGPGVASRRGGILDIFPVGSTAPARVELWGNEIESIRLFDPASQRSTETVDALTVIPAAETLPALCDREHLDRLIARVDASNCTAEARDRLGEEFDRLLDGREVDEVSFYAGFFNRGSLLDYFPPDGLLVMYRPTDIVEAAWQADERTHELRAVKEQRGELARGFPSPHLLWSEVEKVIEGMRRRLDVVPWGAADLGPEDVHALPFTSTPGYLGRLSRFAQEATELAVEGHRVVAVTSLPKRLSEIVAEGGGRAVLSESLDRAPEPGSISVLQSSGAGLSDGFILSVDGSKLIVLCDADIFGVAKQRRSRRRSVRSWEGLLSELHPGDYVVHVDHGIGRFRGTGQASAVEGGGEFLVLEYARGDKLYVPMEHMDRVSPYMAPMERAPSLTRLGSPEWGRTRERVERSTREMAGELLSLYAYRELMQGHPFPSDTAWQAELEDSFPFEETPDQLAAIADVKGDMEAVRPMDRLVCGDVGYGKTEVAVRAAFKAVMGGKQVAVLVPTTVLAQQHYVTFSQRFRAYPVTVEVLSRFRTEREQRAVLEGLAAGKVDVCIGTHRLVQRDVVFKDLGLVIIDEEQRFGVAHKERLKQMRKEVDVLTSTATPIPRTLHLSLAGVRDMSTIDTPPESRLPIKTYVSQFSDELVREAVLREIDREGQVFFLHNRVHSIDYMADYVRAMVPEAEVAVAHGQMPEAELEQTMVDFAEGKMDVLVCTTIIESGLDIPNVNTLVVNRADTFGLAQLYQLRGRIGRGSKRAYAYLLIPPSRSLTETAEKRLKTMLAATELGAGFRIAMKDLEIRGAGNILGSEQSGHIHAVGFELYTRMLADAVEELRAHRALAAEADRTADGAEKSGDEAAGPPFSGAGPAASVDLGMPAYIPQDYIADLPTRLSIYHKLARLADAGGVASMQEELRDRFGPLPWQVQDMLYLARLRLLAPQAGVRSISREGDQIVLRLQDETGGARRPLERVLGPGVRVGNTQIRLEVGEGRAEWEEWLAGTVEKLARFRERVGAQAHAALVSRP